MKPQHLRLQLDIEIDRWGRYTLWGEPKRVCPDHQSNLKEIEDCVFDILIEDLRAFAFQYDSNLSKGARALKKKIQRTFRKSFKNVRG